MAKQSQGETVWEAGNPALTWAQDISDPDCPQSILPSLSVQGIQSRGMALLSLTWL